MLKQNIDDSKVRAVTVKKEVWKIIEKCRSISMLLVIE